MVPVESHRVVREALRVLDVRKLVVGIHDPAFPGTPGEDVGRGSPYSRGADRWLTLMHALGFNGVQLGPQGQTSAINRSPYDGTIFSRNTLSIDLRRLADENGLLSSATLTELAGRVPRVGPAGMIPYGYAFVAQQHALDEAFTRFEATDGARATLDAFWTRHGGWLERDAIYDILVDVHGGKGFRHWVDGGSPHADATLWSPPPGGSEAAHLRRQVLLRDHRRRADGYAFAQMLVHEQHASLRERCRAMGLALYGDLQVGLADRDVFSYRSVLLGNYVMGAPPSRTTPTGQAWDYALLDPEQTELGKPDRNGAIRLLLDRMDKMFDEYDAIRIDHPHGFVCPWAYRPGQPDPLSSVQNGARLFSSPDLPDHPDLARYAIVEPAQLRRTAPRYADDWEIELRPGQIDRFAVFFDAMVDSARRHGRDKQALVCEVLSTLPYPLKAVLERHGLGRFRVVQKANPDDPTDVYHPRSARPEDWIMVGNHDTYPIWSLVQGWGGTDKLDRWAAYLSQRTGLSITDLAARPGTMVHAMFGDMFASAAQNVSIFFTDLFGLDRPYNVPGTVNEQNWSLRLAPTFEEDYRGKLARDEALNLPLALSMAFRARGEEFLRANRSVFSALEGLAQAMRRWP